uniref:Uncharacterized protein n=1 Tax=Acrobeloides nanus TaxID=290746 RepID=A0A914EGU3_9BILA
MSWAFSAIWLFGLVISVCNIPVPFVYRYFYLVKNKKLTGLSYIILLAVPITLNLVYVGIISYLYYPNTEAISIVEQEFGTNFVNDINRIGLVGLASSPGAWIVVFDVLLVSVLCLSTVIWCTIKIRAHLKQHLNYASHATKDMNSQLNWALMAQAISLLSASVVPMLTIIYTIIMKNDAANSIDLIMLAFSWVPWINPLLTIWFVKPYRNALFCRNKVQVQQAVTTENEAHHIHKI